MKYLVIIVSMLYIPSCKKDKAAALKTDAVFIYKTNDADALTYKTLLEAKNKIVDIVEWEAVSNYDFSKVKLVVIGSSGNFLYADTLHASAGKLKSAGNPFIYVGTMGGRIAYHHKRMVNWQSSAGGFATQELKMMNTGVSVFLTPNVIPIPASGNMVLTNPGAPGGYSGFYGFPLPATVQVFAQSTAAAEYKMITVENDTHGHFGWTGSLNDLNTSGKNLLVNLSFALGGL